MEGDDKYRRIKTDIGVAVSNVDITLKVSPNCMEREGGGLGWEGEIVQIGPY